MGEYRDMGTCAKLSAAVGIMTTLYLASIASVYAIRDVNTKNNIDYLNYEFRCAFLITGCFLCVLTVISAMVFFSAIAYMHFFEDRLKKNNEMHAYV